MTARVLCPRCHEGLIVEGACMNCGAPARVIGYTRAEWNAAGERLRQAVEDDPPVDPPEAVMYAAVVLSCIGGVIVVLGIAWAIWAASR